MQSIAFLVLLVASVASASQPQEQVSSAPVQSVPIVGNSPVAVGQATPSQVDGVQPVGEQPPHHVQHGASYYSPAGMITVVGSEPPVSSKPVGAGAVRNFEQYGQPESASLPPNYKPFGSWGLYIGGNPADGYYTNYYKALTNSVDKQAAGEQVKPAAGGQTAAFSPILRQASSSPYINNDFYSFAYSPSDLNSGVHPVAHSTQQGQVAPVAHSVSPVYGAPVDQSYPSLSPYADFYATKKVGAAYPQKELSQKEVNAPSKGYQSRVYVYPPAVQMAAPQASVSGPQQQHVVSYPVPVGSQIVGSQAGVDGAFSPYGVHAFTRYAVKPTVVNQDSSYYYSAQQPVYKQHQQVYTVPSQVGPSYYPFSFYGYPLSQLHYSQGSIVPSSVHQDQYHSSVHSAQVEPVVEKAESEVDKAPKPQKRA